MSTLDRVIWEGWTVRDFIEDLEPQVDMIMRGESWMKPFESKAELVKYLKDAQPYYKKSIPGVNSYFTKKYGLK